MFKIYHWDTFDNETLKIGQEKTLEEAIAFVEKRYGNRLQGSGADKVDIVDAQGNIVWQRSVG